MKTNTIPSINKNIRSVKSCSPDTMIHHKDKPNYPRIVYSLKSKRKNPEDRSIFKLYGVSSSQRVLSTGLLFKEFDRVRDCLKSALGLPTAEREVVLRLLRFYAYYGVVYPKAAQVCQDPGCSPATFWRAVLELESRGLIRRVRRYVTRHHAQISNLYNLHELIIVIARYLAEHGVPFREKWLKPYLSMPGRLFWGEIFQTSEARAGPGGLGLVGP